MKKFFEDQQAAAVLKHGILRRYLPTYARKVGSRSPGGRVAYLDAYAGAGAYETGVPGSPVLAAQTADTLAATRQLETFMVERDRPTYEKLCENLEGAENCVIRRGRIERHLTEFLVRSDGCPAFAFFDPFGLPTSMQDIARVMDRVPATEVLLTFSLPGLRRNAGKLRKPDSAEPRVLKARDTLIGRMDEALGGDWWQKVWERGDDDRNDQIYHGYVERLQDACGHPGYWSVPVKRRWLGPDVYMLLLLTRHRDGIWLFHECMSSAHEEFFQFTHRREPPTLEDQLDYREAQWVDHLASNIEALLPDVFTTRDKIKEVYGDALGVARQTHVRKAVVRLHREGKVLWNGVTPKGEEFPDQFIGPVP
jgi:three-Cys-motif partner protein